MLNSITVRPYWTLIRPTRPLDFYLNFPPLLLVTWLSPFTLSLGALYTLLVFKHLLYSALSHYLTFCLFYLFQSTCLYLFCYSKLQPLSWLIRLWPDLLSGPAGSWWLGMWTPNVNWQQLGSEQHGADKEIIWKRRAKFNKVKAVTGTKAQSHW